MTRESVPFPSSPPSPAGRLSGLCLLLVEDNEINRQLARGILQRAGARVATAADGGAAVALLERDPRRFDAVLMDIRMPGMDGWEAARIIRTRLQLADLPIVALTAGTGEGDLEKALGAGMNALVAKPIDPEELVATLAAQLALPGDKPEEAVPGTPESPATGNELPLPADLPGIDLRTALVRLGGDRRLWISLMRQFEASQGDAVEAVRRLLEAGLGGEAAGVLHRLRGVAANLGAVDAARLATVAEAAVKDGHRSALPALLDSLGEAMSAVCDLARRLPDPVPTGISAATHADLEDGLAELRRLLGSNNLKAAARFGVLRPSLEAVADSETLRSLASAIDNLDFADAERIVINIMKNTDRGTHP